MPRTLLTACSIILGAFAAAPAGATTFVYETYNIVDNTGVTIDYANGNYYEYGGSGQIVLTGAAGNSGGYLNAWCVDIVDSLLPLGTPPPPAGGPYTFTYGSPGNTVPSLSGQQISEMGGLMVYGDNNIGATNVSPATQLAIWSIEYGAIYTFDSTSNAVNTLAAILISEAENPAGPNGIAGSSAWEALTESGNQTLATEVLGYTGGGQAGTQSNTATPEPASFALLGVGLVGLGFIRRRCARGDA